MLLPCDATSSSWHHSSARWLGYGGEQMLQQRLLFHCRLISFLSELSTIAIHQDLAKTTGEPVKQLDKVGNAS